MDVFRRYRRPFTAVFLFSICWLLYARAPVPSIYNHGDNYWYVPAAQSLLRSGTVDMTSLYGTHIEEERARGNWMVVRGRSGWVNYYPAGTSLVSLPLVAAGNLRFATIPAGIERDFLIAAFVARAFAALSAVLFFILAALLTDRLFLSIGLSLLFCFGTTQLSIHSSGLWSHNTSLFLSLAALILLVYRRGRFAGFSALPLALAFLSRPTAALLIGLVIAAMILRRDHKSLVVFSIIGLFGFSAILVSWLAIYGGLPPYFAGEIFSHNLERYGFRMTEALAGLLVSPNRGLFIFMPVSVFSVAGFLIILSRVRVLPWRQILESDPALSNEAHRGSLFFLLGVWVTLLWVIASLNPNWWFGYSFGPRAFAEGVAALILLLIPFLEWMQQRSSVSRIVLSGLMLICAAWGIFANARGAMSPGTAAWNSHPVSVDTVPARVWAWNDLQIFR